MTDFLGRELNINQYVIFSSAFTSTPFYVAKIIGFTKQNVKIAGHPLWPDDRHSIPSQKAPHHLIIVPESDVAFYLLKR